jgi:hypothetical protein
VPFLTCTAPGRIAHYQTTGADQGKKDNTNKTLPDSERSSISLSQ